MMPADWSLLQTPNFGQAALTGYQAGAAIGKQKQINEAMTGVDLSKPETLLPLLRADPSTGAALIGASVKLHAEDRAQQAQVALANAFDPPSAPPATSSSPSSSGASAIPALGTPAITASATPANPLAPGAPPPAGASDPTDPNGEIVVNAPHPAVQQLATVKAMPPTLQQTIGKLVRGGVGLDDALKFVDMSGKMTKAQSDALSDQQDAISSVATAIPKNLSLADRGAWVTAHKDFLLSHNVPEAKIDEFAANPTDEAIQSVQTLALGTKDAMTQAREAAAAAETVKQHGVENAQGQQRIGIEAQNASTSAAHLGIDRAHLSLDQAKFKQTSGAGANGGGIAAPASKSDYNALPVGARYYKNGQVFVKGGGNG